MTGAATMTEPRIAAAEVDRARSELREAVDDLTTLSHHKIERDDGAIDHATAPPLLVQVETEIAQQSAASGAFNPRSRPPLWVDAIQFLADVDAETGCWDGEQRHERVRAWSAYMASQGTPGGIIDARDLAVAWEASARALLDPQPKMRLRGQACPQCKAQKIWDRHDDGAGENHARPALEIDQRRGVCVCLACRCEWPPENWPLLVQVLEQQRFETLQVTGYDTAVRARTDAEAGRRWYD